MPKKRSIILNKKATSISMEEAFWEELDRFASRRGVSWQDFLRELLAAENTPPNRAAAVKESLVRLMRVEGECAAGGGGIKSWWAVEGPEEEKHICTRGVRLLAGRDFSCDIPVRDQEVSRRHLMLSHDGESWWVIDLNSKNGTMINGRRINCARLEPGTRVNIGLSTLRLL